MREKQTGRAGGLSTLADPSTEMGSFARSRFLEHCDDGVDMPNALALRGHETHRQYGVDSFSPIGQRQSVTRCNPVDDVFQMHKIGFYELMIHCVPR